MKVLHLITGGDTGGAKTHVLSLLKELNKGVDVQLLCLIEAEFTEEARALGIPTTIIQQDKRYNLFVVKRIIDFINGGDYDILHCHGARANLLGVLVRPWLSIPMLTTIHSDYRLDFAHSSYKKWVYTPINALALRFIPYYISISDNFKNMLTERGFKADRIFDVYNGISFEEEMHIEKPAAFLGRYGLVYNPETIYIGNVSRIHPVKGIDVFIKAAKDVLKTFPNVQFVIAGDGEERSTYEKSVKKEGLEGNIRFLGHVSDIHSFYELIDINVLSSYTESFPYALLEGARQKKATISSDVGGISRMIEHGKSGYLFKPGDDKELSSYVKALIEDGHKRSMLGQAFYERVKNNFSAKKMAEKHLEIYRKILKKGRREV